MLVGFSDCDLRLIFMYFNLSQKERAPFDALTQAAECLGLALQVCRANIKPSWARECWLSSTFNPALLIFEHGTSDLQEIKMLLKVMLKNHLCCSVLLHK